MLNFIIDTSVFALPPQSNQIEVEKNNLALMKKNLSYLKKLRQSDTVTVSYMNKILLSLKNNNYQIRKAEIDSRIGDLQKLDSHAYESIGLDSPAFEDWNDLIKNMIPRKDAEGKYHKGNIGIFNNIPDREKDPNENYAAKTSINEDECIYPELTKSIKLTYIKYCGYIADLNQKYGSANNNYIVLGEKYGEMAAKDITVALTTAYGKIQSQISIVGIQKAETLCRTKLKFKNLLTACEEARKHFNLKLVFGKEISKGNIEKNLFPQAGPPVKVYYYLQTLDHVSGIIDEKNIEFNENSGFRLVEMLNAYGLLCSSDSDKYITYKCKFRSFENESGKKEFYYIHLKPSTYRNIMPDDDDDTVGNYTLALKETVRIYLEWDNTRKQMRIGWIGHHPVSCSECGYMECHGYRRKFVKVNH